MSPLDEKVTHTTFPYEYDECSSTKPHFHKNEQGELVKCFHECKSIVRQPSFWILTTLTFPIEHGIWSLIYHLFGWSH